MLPGEFNDEIIGRLKWLTDVFGRTLQIPEEEETSKEASADDAEIIDKK